MQPAERPVTRALDRGLHILEVLAERSEANLADIASATRLSPATALRLLDTLRRRDFVEHDRQRGIYRIGLRAFEVGSHFLAHTRLQETCHAILQHLARDTGHSVALAILQQNDGVYIDVGDSGRSIRTSARLGVRVPLHASATGKILIAWLWEGRIGEIIGPDPLPALTRKTITERATLMRELADVRQSDVAFDREEFEIGITCIAAPVRDRTGDVVAAISLSSATGQLAERETHLVDTLRSTAQDASRRLGWRPRDRISLARPADDPSVLVD